MPSSGLVTISTHHTVLEAELARSRLQASGIEGFVHAPHAHGLYPGVLGEVSLQVRKEDLARAKNVLELK